MPATYEPIASQTLGSNTATVTFSSIPGTFTDLVLVAFARSTRTADNYDGLRLRFNSDTGSNYSRTLLLYGPSSSRNSNQTGTESARMNTSTSSNTNMSAMTVQIMSYANTNVFKTVLGAGAGLNDFFGLDRNVNLWRSTSAITSIDITSAQGDNIASGSTFSLYGIKAA